MLPKVQGPADVVEVDNLLTHFERSQGMEFGQILIDTSLETARTMLALARELGAPGA